MATLVLALDVAGDRITRIWVIRNPEKLGRSMTGPGGAVTPP